MATIAKTKPGKDGRPRWQAQIRLKGRKRYRTFARKRDAEAWARKTEREIDQGLHAEGAEDKRTLADLIDRYMKVGQKTTLKNRAAQNRQLLWWRAALGEVQLTKLKQEQIEDLHLELSKPLDPSAPHEVPDPNDPRVTLYARAQTANRYLAAIFRVLTWGVGKGWLRVHPAKGIERHPEPGPRLRILTADEKGRLLAACERAWTDPPKDAAGRKYPNHVLHPLVVVALSTGARYGELARMRWEHIDWQNRSVMIPVTKSGEPRSLHLSKTAYDALRSLYNDHRLRTPWVFGAATDGKSRFPRRPWNAACERAGIENLRFHDLRANFATAVRKGGGNLLELQGLLGHKTESMVKRYAAFGVDRRVASLVEAAVEADFDAATNGQSRIEK